MSKRRNIRREIAIEMEKYVLDFKPTIEVEPTQTDEVARQLAYVQEPLLKKLQRAQGHGKQTGKILTGPKVTAEVEAEQEPALA